MRRIHAAALVFGIATLFATVELASAQAEDTTEEGAPVEKKPESTGSTLKTVGSYVLGAVGLGLLLISVTKTFGGLSYPAARLSLINLLRTNPNQAEMVAKGMEGTFGEAIGAAMKMGAMGGTTDPAILSSMTVPSYDGTGTAIAARWGALIGKGKLALMAAGGGFVLGLTGDGFPVIPFIMALLAVGCFVRVFLYKSEVESTIVRARHEVLPEVNTAMASGRYAFPPPKY
ncbi:MAG: hypothetical protein JWP01_375 [Myxococcales bacterium]|nr:hypothetical protein [Myxococcales bacterium]